MITVNYNLFLQLIFYIWVFSGVANVIVGAFEHDTKKQATEIFAGLIMLAIALACMVL
ncbi:MAG: hypothetical protein WC365_01130 [Candidatus Babeliales bacterium]|jgi:uncharacterized membrane protein